MISYAKLLLAIFLIEHVTCADQELSCRDSAGCKNGFCRPTILDDVGKLKEELTANESPVKCNDPIGGESFLQLYLQNKNDIEDLDAELDRAVKSQKELESILGDLSTTNELSFEGREETFAELDRKIESLETLQANISKELSDINETVIIREYQLNIAETAVDGLRTDIKKLNKALLLSKSPCEFNIADICYWTKVDGRYSFIEAMEVCENNRSSVANVTSKSIYDAIIENIRNKIKSARIWTGITVEPGTWSVKPVNSFTKWKLSDDPLQGPRFTSYTNVYLHVFRVTNKVKKNGMVNVPPTWKMEGVICQFSI